MSANFNFSRFLKLTRKQWIENARIYFFSILALIGILGLVFVFWIVTGGFNYHEEFLYVFFTLGLYVFGAVFASISFGMLTDKRQGIYWLGFPASHLEKLLTVIFFNVIIFTIVYSLCFFLMKTLAVAYVHNLIATDPFKYSYQLADWNKDTSSFTGSFPYFIYGFFAVQAFYLLGSVYFSRFSFIMTTVIGVALVFLFMWFSISLIENSLGKGFSWDGFSVSQYGKRFDYNGDKYKYRLPFLLFTTLLFLMKFIWAPVFWLVTWFRLKEKEI